MTLLGFIVIGGLAGWIASMIIGNNKDQGIVGNIIVGIIGAFLGGFLVRLFGGNGFAGFDIGSLLVAVLGAVVFLYVFRKVAHKA